MGKVTWFTTDDPSDQILTLQRNFTNLMLISTQVLLSILQRIITQCQLLHLQVLTSTHLDSSK